MIWIPNGGVSQNTKIFFLASDSNFTNLAVAQSMQHCSITKGTAVEHISSFCWYQ
jgi:hypothetical protein